MASPWERLRRVDPRIWDAAMALMILALSVAVLVVSPTHAERDETRPADVLAFALIGLGCLPLIARRRRALAVAVVVSVACVAYALLDYSGGLVVALILASYSAAAHAERDRVVMIALPVTLVAAVVIAIHDGGVNWPEGLVEVTFAVGIPMMFGRIGFNRRRRIAREQERAARDAVLAERARIARELHDVVAHAMSVMVVQAGAARMVVRREPERAEGALLRIEETGRTGLQEMRRLIGVLKEEEDDLALAPQPGLGELEPLLTTVRGAGLSVESLVEGTPRDLPPGVDLTAYRVIQEALTNAIKHAGDGAHARVVTRYRPEGLDLEVADDGVGPTAGGGQTGGNGLIGMRERLALFGGSLDASARPGGGFLVRASIPLEPETPR
jgi:signal transduction histidine kinase